ncbi:MAG: peptidoglycan recognition family protein, partial [Planctomycetota bacterium]|nr:peptidoglycan recognition family protein [Planctomycetota bacterium]
MKGMLFVVLGLGFVAACANPGSRPMPPDDGPDYRVDIPRTNGTVPPWAGRARSWEKLAMIGTWLQSEGHGDAYWVVEGHLQLAEGRAYYAIQEPNDKELRKSKARAGYHRVLAHGHATASQRQRAEIGLRGLDGASTPINASAGIPGVLSRADWGARLPNARRLDPASKRWNYITIHHSAEPGASPLNGSWGDSVGALRDIQSAHMNGEGYGDIGYHFLIDPAGRIFEGRELRYQGAHAYGKNNVGNVGVCLLGNFEHERPTQEALESMHGLIDILSGKFGRG